jgi:hypothetical protein
MIEVRIPATSINIFEAEQMRLFIANLCNGHFADCSPAQEAHHDYALRRRVSDTKSYDRVAT